MPRVGPQEAEREPSHGFDRAPERRGRENVRHVTSSRTGPGPSAPSRTSPRFKTALRAILPSAGRLLSYRREFLRSDVPAGLTVAVLLIPQSMAYAALAGMPPEAGLYSAIVSLLVYAALGTSSFISVAPVAIDSLLVAAAVGPIAQGDTGLYAAAAGVLAVMTGVVQLALGLLRLGALVNFLSVPVISGFTSAAALTIGASQSRTCSAWTCPGARAAASWTRHARRWPRRTRCTC